jgi:hypothetical protein
VGVLAPNEWQVAHCVVPLSDECALDSGPGEICAQARGTPSRHDAVTSSKSTAQRFSPKTTRRFLRTPGALLRTLSSAMSLWIAGAAPGFLLTDCTRIAFCRDSRPAGCGESCTEVQLWSSIHHAHELLEVFVAALQCRDQLLFQSSLGAKGPG